MAFFGLTIFVGAFLLFQVQPLIARYILPWFGGTPGVWTTCLLFFQLALLGGYAYAHVLTRRFKLRDQAVVHLLLTGVALALLPVIPADSWKPAGSGNPTGQILLLLTACVGLPFFVLSATGPLLQHWFSRTHPGVSPFRLYALSNAGSLLALVSFPVCFEPHFTRPEEAGFWGWGLAIYAVGCAVCAANLWRQAPVASQLPNCSRRREEAHTISGSERESLLPLAATGGLPTLHPPPSTLNRLLWLLLPACASVLLLATTNKICQDVAVIPFLWVLPLSLYLLSFIISFDSPRWYRRRIFVPAFLAAVTAICWALFKVNEWSILRQIGIYSAGLFVGCMICHGELYRLRPDPRQLTGFYLGIAVGGALGGLLVAVGAPLLFTDFYELQWGLLLCGVLLLFIMVRSGLEDRLLPGHSTDSNQRENRGGDGPSPRLKLWSTNPGDEPSPPPCLNRPWLDHWLRHRRRSDDIDRARARRGHGHQLAVAGLALCLLGFAGSMWWEAHRFAAHRLERTRNFYGVLTVLDLDLPQAGLHFRELAHGRTSHGLQFIDPERAAWPTLYFGEHSGVGLALHALPANHRRIGLVGLGTGTLATYAKAGDYFHSYEINPEIPQLANRWFSFLTNCLAHVEVTPGDGRLSLEQQPPQDFDLLALDAFNSDAVPMHLLTKEAFAIYLRHVKPGGIMAVDISNRSVDLEPVAANLARCFQLYMVVIESYPPPAQPWLYRSSWVLLSRSNDLLGSPTIQAAARPESSRPKHIPLWTDDFASLFPLLRREARAETESAATKALAASGLELVQHGNYAGAIAQYQLALKGQPNSTFVPVQLSLLLALCPDASLRNVPAAIQLMKHLCELTHYAVPPQVAVLAEVYSEGGHFTEAAAMQAKVGYLTGETPQSPQLPPSEDLLAWYRSGHPYHEFRLAKRVAKPDPLP